jgi:hypothetical protein
MKQNVGFKDRASVVIRNRKDEIVKEVSSDKRVKEDESSRKTHDTKVRQAK